MLPLISKINLKHVVISNESMQKDMINNEISKTFEE
jgi:hypothetical protein